MVSDFGEERNLIFNPDKSAIVEFAGCADSERAFLVQNRSLPMMDSYKYLGVTLSNGNNYLEEQEKIWEARAEKVLRQMHARALWGFNRFEITKIQWKSTAVPALTYANSVTIMSSRLRKRLESLQRKAGRWALGEPSSKTAIEFIDGELGWSTFEAREAKSKLIYAARRNRMSESRWPRAIHTMLEIVNLNTKYRKRCKDVKTKFARYEIQ